MKKLLSLVIVLLSGFVAFAASPDLQDITLTDYNSGETLGPQTLSGTILYKTGSGYVLYVKLEYGTFKASERLVLPRWAQR